MIETAIQSVIDQGYPDYEHIIIDGGSTDGTLEVLKKYPHLIIVSEPDSGMYEALNKGLQYATGDLIGFLNSDDIYARDAFFKIEKAYSLIKSDAVAGLAGMVCDLSDISNNPGLLHPGMDENRIEHTLLERPIFNAYFFSCEVFKSIAPFDTRYKIIADREFLLRFTLANKKLEIIDSPVYYYLIHPESLTNNFSMEKFRLAVDEHLQFSKSYLESKENFSQVLRKSFIELRTRETIRVSAHCFRQKEFAAALKYVKEGIRYNPLWIWRFLRHAMIHPIRQKLKLPYQSP
jgi:glycosyltransferase involved in cell wall biosynthesis